ncbi:MAG: TonB-dependent receptor [Balneolaceae bacterium]
MSKISTIIIFGVFLCTSLVQAQNAQVADSLELDTIVITASKTPTSSRETTRPVVVITEKQIQQNAGKDIAELLNQQSGISINGALSNPSKDKGVYLQGASTQYTLILIDGQPVNDPSGAGGAFDLRLFPLSSVERIEVVKGSMSTLYGSDAIAGVINIITKKPTNNTVQVNGLSSYGSHNSFLGSLGVNGKLDRVGYSLNYSREQSDGINEATDASNAGNFDKDGFSRDAVNARLNVDVIDGLSISPFLNYSSYDGDFDADAFTDGINSYEAELINPGVNLDYSTTDISLKGRYNFNKVERIFKDAFGTSAYKGNMQNADLFGTYTLSNNVKILGGFNFQKVVLDDGNNTTDNPEAALYSPYVNVLLTNGSGLGAELGLRFNNHSDAGSNLNYSFSPYYNITENVRVLGSLSTGFKAPTLNELFGPFGANPDLKSQQSRYADIGLDFFALKGRLNAKAMYFNRYIEDVIIYAFPNGYINQNEQSDHGFEFTSSWIANEMISLNGFYNYVTGEATSDDGTGQEVKTDNLIRRPKHSVGLNLSLQPIQQLTVNIGGSYTGERQDLFFNPNNFYASEEVTLDAFTLINLYAEYRFPVAGITLFGDVKNVFNEDYTEVYGFNTLGTTAKLGVRFKL